MPSVDWDEDGSVSVSHIQKRDSLRYGKCHYINCNKRDLDTVLPW